MALSVPCTLYIDMWVILSSISQTNLILGHFHHYWFHRTSIPLRILWEPQCALYFQFSLPGLLSTLFFLKFCPRQNWPAPSLLVFGRIRPTRDRHKPKGKEENGWMKTFIPKSLLSGHYGLAASLLKATAAMCWPSLPSLCRGNLPCLLVLSG